MVNPITVTNLRKQTRKRHFFCPRDQADATPTVLGKSHVSPQTPLLIRMLRHPALLPGDDGLQHLGKEKPV